MQAILRQSNYSKEVGGVYYNSFISRENITIENIVLKDGKYPYTIMYDKSEFRLNGFSYIEDFSNISVHYPYVEYGNRERGQILIDRNVVKRLNRINNIINS